MITPLVPDSGLLRQLSDSGFIAWKDEPVIFNNSKLTSHVYVGGREDLTHNPGLLASIGGVIASTAQRMVRFPSTPCLIGIPSAGRTLAQAAAMQRESMCAFEVLREKKKRHGAHRCWVDGSPRSGFTYLTIDNTITDGASKFDTFDHLHEDEYPVRTMDHLVLVDRQEGGLQRLQAAGYKMTAIWQLRDILKAFGEHGFWPTKHVATGLKEISANRKIVLG